MKWLIEVISFLRNFWDCIVHWRNAGSSRTWKLINLKTFHSDILSLIWLSAVCSHLCNVRFFLIVLESLGLPITENNLLNFSSEPSDDKCSLLVHFYWSTYSFSLKIKWPKSHWGEFVSFISVLSLRSLRDKNRKILFHLI